MKWIIEELDGMEAVEGVEANPGADPPVEEVIAVEGKEGNQLLRNAEMIQLATDGLYREFKIHCDFTNVNLRNIDFPTLEVEVQHWQRNTTTGKTFTAACTPANHGTKHANVSALELSDYFDMDKNNPPDDAETSAATTSNRGQRGGRGNRGSGRGARGRGGRNMSCQQTKPAIQSKDVQDGGFNNYKQTPDGKVILSPQGHPLCNYCGTPSHKRESCGIKRADRAAGLTRTVHPDRDNPRPKSAKSTSTKAKTSEATIAAAAQVAHTQQYPPPYPIVQWNYPVAIPLYKHWYTQQGWSMNKVHRIPKHMEHKVFQQLQQLPQPRLQMLIHAHTPIVKPCLQTHTSHRNTSGPSMVNLTTWQ